MTTKPIPAPASGIDPDSVIAEMLIECRDAVKSCIALGNEPDYEEIRGDLMMVVARLMKTSLAIATSLKRNADFTHRIIVERDYPPTPQISGKTIHGVRAGGKVQEIE